MPLAATARPDHIRLLHITYGKAEPYAQAFPGHLKKVLSVELFSRLCVGQRHKEEEEVSERS